MNIVFLGPPGAGKGTLSKKLSLKKGWLHISTGDLVRREIRMQTELGKKIQSIVNSGRLVDDKLVTRLLEKKIQNEKKVKGIIFDGFPRNTIQAKALEKMLSKLGLKLNTVVYLDVSKKTVVSRLSARRQCNNCNEVYNLLYNPPKKDNVCDKCSGQLYQRKDDSPKIVKQRFEVFKKETRPLLDYYKEKKLLKIVSAESTVKKNLEQVMNALQ